MINHFEFFIIWFQFLFMFYRGCSRFSFSSVSHLFGIGFLFFLSYQFFRMSFKIEKNWKVLVSCFFLFFYLFGSCHTGALVASKQNRERNKSTKNFKRTKLLLVTGGWEAVALTRHALIRLSLKVGRGRGTWDAGRGDAGTRGLRNSETLVDSRTW